MAAFRRAGYGLVGLTLCLFAGCRKSEPPQSPGSSEKQEPVAAIVSGGIKSVSRPSDARHLAFDQVTTPEPPSEAFRPVDMTSAGKSVGKLYEQIAGKGGLWEQIWFVSADGRPLTYSVTLQTDLGDILIELWPDVAPNHVRNFLALAKAGYYDGLVFHATIRDEIADDKGNKRPYEYLEAGCPLGSGEPGFGSIGYWLKAELHDPEKLSKVRHEPGTVGAWHGSELDSAGCKFYITLSKAPWMDGGYTVFGKVSKGLDVSRQILIRPTCSEPGLQDRPRDPVLIRSVVIHTSISDVPAAHGQSR